MSVSYTSGGRARVKRDGTCAETRFRLSPKRTSPFKSAGTSVQSTAGSRDARIGGSNAGYTTFRGGVKVLATHSIRQFPLHFPSRASPCAIRFQTSSNTHFVLFRFVLNSDVTHCVGYELLLMLVLPDRRHDGSVQYAQSILTSVSV